MNTVLTQDIKQFADNFPLKDKLRNQTIAITGATGLLGSCMTRCLLMLNRKHQLKLRVIAIVRNAEKARQMFGEETKSFGILTYDFAQHVPFDTPEHIDSLIHFAAPTASKAFVEQPIETM
ncbi:MAG: dTDP-glucose 4,6-dehydratase, partial [Prevotella bivia]|nr:dTDP-glucose 4,6-dehydratase [Prevotella bivia]